MIHILKCYGGTVGYYQDTKPNLKKLLKEWEEEGMSIAYDKKYSFKNLTEVNKFLLKEINVYNESRG